MADEPENLVLELLRAMRADIARLDTKTDALGDRLDAKIDAVDAKLNGKIDAVDAKVNSIALTGAAVHSTQQQHGHILEILRHEIAPGEMGAVNRDLRQMRRELDDMSFRVDALERQQGR